MQEIICIKSRLNGQVMYIGFNEADAHKAASAHLEQKPIKTYVHMSEKTRLAQTEQYRQAYNGIDPLHWYIH
jgi:uncharacterized protein YlaI